MAEFEPLYNFDQFRDSRFQPIPGYEDYEKAPVTVIGQTDSLLQLFRAGSMRQPEIARDYLKNYTLRFLDTAAEGVERVFTKDEAIIDAQPLDINEAADYTNVVLPGCIILPLLNSCRMDFREEVCFKRLRQENSFYKEPQSLKENLLLL